MAEQFVVTDRMESLIAMGDLSKLNEQERIIWYRVRCEAAGLDWRTNPFQYITLNGKLVLYPKLEALQQIADKKGVSTIITDRQILGDAFVVTCRASDPTGRAADSMGAVFVKGLVGEAYCNALLKSESKARRRAIMALCGLGGTDDEAAQEIGGTRVALNHSTPQIGERVSPPRLAITAANAEVVDTVSSVQETRTEEEPIPATNWTDEKKEMLAGWRAGEFPEGEEGIKLFEQILNRECPKSFFKEFSLLWGDEIEWIKSFIANGEMPRHAIKPVVIVEEPVETYGKGKILAAQIGAIVGLWEATKQKEQIPDMQGWTMEQGAELIRSLQTIKQDDPKSRTTPKEKRTEGHTELGADMASRRIYLMNRWKQHQGTLQKIEEISRVRFTSFEQAFEKMTPEQLERCEIWMSETAAAQ
jgi:hypothetical protein